MQISLHELKSGRITRRLGWHIINRREGIYPNKTNTYSG
jgi:hypothetical protein